MTRLAQRDIFIPLVPLGLTTAKLDPLYTTEAVVGKPIYPDLNGQHPKHARKEIMEKYAEEMVDCLEMAYDLREFRPIKALRDLRHT